jgi:hypothetical protein
MNKSEIISFYKAYKSQILSEMKEYLDQPLKYITGYSRTTYIVSEDNIKAIYSFRSNFHDKPNPHFDISKVNHSYSIEWRWYEGMDDTLKTSQNFLRVLASGYKVIVDFINNESPDVLSFSGLSKGHDSVYFGDVFQKRLRTLIGDEYDVVNDENNSVVFIINKTISNLKSEAITKRAETTSLQESIIYWKYNNLHPSTPHNVKIKNIIKKRVIENLYLK